MDEETQTNFDVSELPIEQPIISQEEPQAGSIETNETATPDEKPKKQRKLAAILGVVLGILVLGGGVATTVIMMNSNEKVAQDQQEVEPEPEPMDFMELSIKGNGLDDFDLAFIKMHNGEENTIYSPLSIKYALAMLADGAAGESQEQITRVIGEYTPKAYLNSENRSIANALFVRSDLGEIVKDSYIGGLKTKYNAEVVTDTFETPNNVNKWVSDKTLGIINNMFDEGTLNLRTTFMLVNTLAIDMHWNNQLQCELENYEIVPCKAKFLNVEYAHEDYDKTGLFVRSVMGSFETMTFNDKEDVEAAKVGVSANRYNIIDELGEDYIRETVWAEYEKWLEEVADDVYMKEEDKAFDLDKYMNELAANYGRFSDSTDFYFYDADDAKVFGKDLQEYDGATLQYVGIMPKTEDLRTYAEGLTAEKASGLIDNLKDANELESYTDGVVTRLSGFVPFFKFSYEINDLAEDLRKVGITNVFSSEDADLSNMVEDGGMGNFIYGSIHKADIDFSNNGITAAAATGDGGMGSAKAGFDYEWDVPTEEIDITFDRPFLFLIRDKDSGEVWFAGAVYNL